jgi:prolyl-tRNA synthetase
MRQSLLFTKTQKKFPKGEKSKNSQLLIRAGFIDKLAAGVFTFLPLGFLVLKKIENIIRQEMQKIGGQEILMPALHPKELWLKTGRWRTLDVLFKLKGRDNKEYALGATHEEILVPIVKKFLFSYKDLPIFVYQIQEKFRDELRPKSGLLRAKEFLMKDLYSFHTNEKDLNKYYEKVTKAYFKIFERCKIKDRTYLTLASGGTFSKYSHEFQTVTPGGEDTIFICKKCNLAINKEIKPEMKKCPDCGSVNFRKEKAIEVANIFKLGMKYSTPFGLTFVNKNGEKSPVIMGCYGIGLGRLMGAIVEVWHDKKGIIWPKEVAPFSVHLIPIKDNQKVKRAAEKIYKNLEQNKIEVLYDDRGDKTPGEKLIDCDLIGIPIRLVVSEKTLSKNSVEIKKRAKEKKTLIKLSRLNSYLQKLC